MLGANLTSGPGVYVHNLAMRGGSGTLFDDVPDADWKALQEHTNPALVVLQFGGNAVPSISNAKGARRYAQKVGQNIRHIQAQWPGVPILFIGPSDMGEGLSTYPGLQHTVTALRDTVLANHALHWDLQAVMGGPGAMEAMGGPTLGWRRPRPLLCPRGARSGPKAHASACTRTGLVGQPTDPTRQADGPMTMSFTSWEFWLLFACAFMASTWLNGTDSKLSEARAVRLRSGLLLAFSVGFYLLAAAPCAVILASSVLLNHGLGKLIHKLQGPARAWTTAIGVAFNVLGLAAFKYAFFIDDTFGLGLLTSGTFRLDAWMLPLGISFFTFQAISFLVDVHRRTLATPPDLLSFATYLTFFPQLVAGPIVRATSFLPQLASPTWNTAPSALKPFVMLLVQGMVKKVLLGDVVGTWLVDPAFDDPGSTPAAWILVALYGYSLQVYADFSGYTDMAQGMAGLLGIHLPEISTSPTALRLRESSGDVGT